MERWLNRVWYEGGAERWLLAPLSWAFGGVVAARRSAYRTGLLARRSVGAPVVVVGNLSVGGTGKTPVVIWLAGALAARGLRVGVVARGYGARITEPRRVDPARSQAAEVGDEPLLIARETGVPVVVAPDRVAAARRLVEESRVELVLADDGLQHYALARDLEVLVVDAQRGFGNGWLLPAGPLREAPERARQVQAVVRTHVARRAAEPALAAHSLPELAAHTVLLDARLALGAARALGDPRQSRDLASFRGQRVHAVAGIGDPARFFDALRAVGLDPIEHPFPDHHAFRRDDLQFDAAIADAHGAPPVPVLMTSKDAVKCRPLVGGEDRHFWEVPLVLEVAPDGGRALIERILALVGGRPSTAAPDPATRRAPLG